MKVRIPRPVVLLTAVLVLVGGGGTWAWPAVPDVNKQFHGCYLKDKTVPYKYFVMIDPAEGTKCPTGYGAVDWSTGGAGAGGRVYTAFATPDGHVEFNVPAGKYVVTGKALMANKTGTPALSECDLTTSAGADVLHTRDLAGATVPASGFATMSVEAVLDLSEDTQLDLTCGGGGNEPGNVRLVATTVASIN